MKRINLVKKFAMNEKAIKNLRQFIVIFTILVWVVTAIATAVIFINLFAHVILLERANRAMIGDMDLVKKAVLDIVLIIPLVLLYILSSKLDEFWKNDDSYDKYFLNFLLRKDIPSKKGH